MTKVWLGMGLFVASGVGLPTLAQAQSVDLNALAAQTKSYMAIDAKNESEVAADSQKLAAVIIPALKGPHYGQIQDNLATVNTVLVEYRDDIRDKPEAKHLVQALARAINVRIDTYNRFQRHKKLAFNVVGTAVGIVIPAVLAKGLLTPKTYDSKLGKIFGHLIQPIRVGSYVLLVVAGGTVGYLVSGQAAQAGQVDDADLSNPIPVID